MTEDKIVPLRKPTEREIMANNADKMADGFTESLRNAYKNIPANHNREPNTETDGRLDKSVVIQICNEAIGIYHRTVFRMIWQSLEMQKTKKDHMSAHVEVRCRFMLKQITYFVGMEVNKAGIDPEEIKWF